MNHRRDDVSDDRGSVTIFVAVLGLSFLMAAGLALDGARKLGGLTEAREHADNAARNCVQGVHEVYVRALGRPDLDPGPATARANGYLAFAGISGTVSVVGTRCIVTVTLTIPTLLLPGPYVVSATESAQALPGIKGASP